MIEYQTTIYKPFSLSGPGLHTGRFTHVTVCPADADCGVRFVRTDLQPYIEIPALADLVTGTNHGTTVAVGDASVSTIEHLMSALHGMRLDNVMIEVDGPEIPILDGSARLWVEQIKRSGVKQLNKERQYFVLTRKVQWKDEANGILLEGEPYDGFVVDSTIEFNSQLIGSQNALLDGYEMYETDISRCRTFVFLHEVEVLLAHNLIKGGDLDNAIVFVDKPLGDDEKTRLAALFNKDKESINVANGVLNTIQPFFPNEPARHKLLDFVGDIYLTGCFLKGRFKLKCPGHRANVAFAQAIRLMLNGQ